MKDKATCSEHNNGLDCFFEAEKRHGVKPSSDFMAMIYQTADDEIRKQTDKISDNDMSTANWRISLQEFVRDMGGWITLTSGALACIALGIFLGLSPISTSTENVAGLLSENESVQILALFGEDNLLALYTPPMTE